MLRIVFCVFTLLVLATSGFAQTFIQVGTGNDTLPGNSSHLIPIYRTSDVSDMRFSRGNSLLSAAELSGLPVGARIKSVAWHKANDGATINGNPLRMEIWMRQSPYLQTPLPTNMVWSIVVDSFKRVYENANLTIADSSGWINFPFARDFVYEAGALELATASELSGALPYTTSRFSWTYTTGQPNQVVGQISSQALPPLLNLGGSASRTKANIRIYYEQPMALDLQLEDLISPAPPVLGTSQQQIGVSFLNAGTSILSSAAFSCRLNDGTVASAQWTGSLAPGQRTTFNFPQSFQMPPFGNAAIEVWVGAVNGATNDGYALNDTIREQRCLSFLPGQYFVGNDTADFETLTEALEALHCGGVNGPVDLILMPGTYRGHYEIRQIPGTNSANVVTITSYLGNAPEVVFYEDDIPLHPEIFKISGGSHLRLEQLRFVRSSFDTNVNGGLIRITDAASQLKIKDCIFIDSSDVIGSLNAAIQVEEASQVKIDSNYFQAFGNAIRFVGSGLSEANSVRGNRFVGFGSGALGAANQFDFEVRDNVFQDGYPFATSGTCSLLRITGLEMYNNSFIGQLQLRVLTINDMNGDPQRRNRVYNNSIAGYMHGANEAGSTVLLRPISILGSVNASTNNVADQLEFINNSIQIQLSEAATLAPSSSILGVIDASTTAGFDSLAIVNNVFAAYGENDTLPERFSAVYITNDAATGLLFDFNNYYLQNSPDSMFVIGVGGVRINQLSTWQQRRNFDNNSHLFDPVFVSPISTLPTSDSLNNKGLTIPWMTSDIKGVYRPTADMDLGAHEFEQPNVELLLDWVSVPPAACQPGDSVLTFFEVSNLGSQPLQNPRFVLNINGQLVERKIFTGLNILPQATVLLQFDSAYNFNSYGSYNIQVWADTSYDAFSPNDTVSNSTFTQQIDFFPFTQDFDQAFNGRLQDFSGWYAVDSAFSWLVRNGQSPYTQSGPLVDHTKGDPSGKYIFAATGMGQLGDSAIVYSSCFEISGLSLPMIEYWYHGNGINCDELRLQQWVGGAWETIDSLLAPTHSVRAEDWKRRRVFIYPQSTQLRFVTVKTGPSGAWAIDDVRMADFPMVDVVLEGLDLQYTQCDTTTLATAVLRLRSDGWFANATGVRAGIRVDGGAAVYRQTNRLLLPGGVDTLQFHFVMNDLGLHTITAFAAEPADTDFELDTIHDQLFLQGIVNHYPYEEDFEGNHLWFSDGFLNSWQAGPPAGILFNSAFSGQHAWVTNLTGRPNQDERSVVTSPCFDFSQLEQPSVSFQFRCDMQTSAGVNLEYSTDGGLSWSVLGNAHQVANWYTVSAINFFTAFTPVWTGSTNPQLWRKAEFDLRFLAGEPNVKFRFKYYSGVTSFSAFEGFTFDDFSITDPEGCFVSMLDTMQDACVPAARTIHARIGRPAELQSIELLYAVNGGVEQAVPMTSAGGNQFVAVIPAQSMGQVVRYRVRTLGSVLYESQSLHYIDGLLSMNIADQTAPTNTPALFDARLAAPLDLVIGLSNLSAVSGYWMELTAKRHLELDELSIQARSETGVDIYLIQGDAHAAGLNAAKVEHLGTYLNIASLGFSRFMLDRPILMREGQQAILYVQATVPNSLRASFAVGPTVLEDSSLAVRAGRVITNNFQQTGQWTFPSMIFHVKNPADAVRWQEGAGPVINGSAFDTKIPMDSSRVRLELTRNACVWTDSAMLRSTGQIDVGITQILQPDFTVLIPNEFYAVKVVLKNHGSLPVGGISMAYQVDGAEYGISSTGRAINPGDTIHFTYPQFFSWSGVDTPVFCSYPKFVLIDANRTNDTLCVTAFATSASSLRMLSHQLYPNPAQDLLWIDWEGQGELHLELVNSLGSVVLRRDWRDAPERVSVAIDGLATGLYHYRLRSRQQTAQGKLVVTK